MAATCPDTGQLIDCIFPFHWLYDLKIANFISFYYVDIEDLKENKKLSYHGPELDYFNLNVLEGSQVLLYYDDEPVWPVDIKKSLLDVLSGKYSFEAHIYASIGGKYFDFKERIFKEKEKNGC